MDESQKLFITLTVTTAIALLGFFIKYLYDLSLARRKDRLERLNKQLGDFYGPIYALLKSNEQAWISLKSKLQISGSNFDPNTSLTEQQVKIWRIYMKSIYLPANDRIYDVLVSKSDLLIEDTIPECLLQLMSHIVAYKAVVKGWDLGENQENSANIIFPEQARTYIYEVFGVLKSEQYTLLNKNYYISNGFRKQTALARFMQTGRES